MEYSRMTVCRRSRAGLAGSHTPCSPGMSCRPCPPDRKRQGANRSLFQHDAGHGRYPPSPPLRVRRRCCERWSRQAKAARHPTIPPRHKTSGQQVHTRKHKHTHAHTHTYTHMAPTWSRMEQASCTLGAADRNMVACPTLFTMRDSRAASTGSALMRAATATAHGDTVRSQRSPECERMAGSNPVDGCRYIQVPVPHGRSAQNEESHTSSQRAIGDASNPHNPHTAASVLT